MSRSPWRVPDHKPDPNDDDIWRRTENHGHEGAPNVAPTGRMTRFIVFVAGIGLLLFGLSLAFPNEGFLSDPYLIRALIILLIFGGAAAFWSRSSLMRLAKVAGLWALIIFCIVVFYLYRSDFGERFMAAVDPSGVVDSEAGLVVRRGVDGHFWLRATINGVPVRLMVDTGASNVVLSPEDARRVGLNPASLQFTGRAGTANGDVSYARATVDIFKVGSAEFYDVPVTVNGAEMQGSLMGMTALNRFASVEFRSDVMILRP